MEPGLLHRTGPHLKIWPFNVTRNQVKWRKEKPLKQLLVLGKHSPPEDWLSTPWQSTWTWLLQWIPTSQMENLRMQVSLGIEVWGHIANHCKGGLLFKIIFIEDGFFSHTIYSDTVFPPSTSPTRPTISPFLQIYSPVSSSEKNGPQRANQDKIRYNKTGKSSYTEAGQGNPTEGKDSQEQARERDTAAPTSLLTCKMSASWSFAQVLLPFEGPISGALRRWMCWSFHELVNQKSDTEGN